MEIAAPASTISTKAGDTHVGKLGVHSPPDPNLVAPYRGYFINLDKNIDRLMHVEKQLFDYKLKSRYTRFPACAGNALKLKAPKLSPGQIGCFSSHYLLLKSQINSPAHVHVTEDDVVFSPAIAAVLDSQLPRGLLGDYDLLYTEVFIPIDQRHVRDMAVRFRQSTLLDEKGCVKSVTNFSVLPLKDRVFACTASYLVNKRSIAKVVSILEEAMQSEITMPIDLYFRQKTYEGRIKAGCLFPFVTTVNLRLSQASDIALSPRKNLETSLFATTILRNLFYVHSKPSELLSACEAAFGHGAMDDRDKVLASIYRFGLSPNFVCF